MTARLVLVIGDLFIPDRAPVSFDQHPTPYSHFINVNHRFFRTSHLRYASLHHILHLLHPIRRD